MFTFQPLKVKRTHINFKTIILQPSVYKPHHYFIACTAFCIRDTCYSFFYFFTFYCIFLCISFMWNSYVIVWHRLGQSLPVMWAHHIILLWDCSSILWTELLTANKIQPTYVHICLPIIT